MLKKTIEWTIPLALAGIMTGCATYRPPAQIQSAVATVNRHTPEYVTEANKALREIGHPDAERRASLPHQAEFRLGIGRETVDGDHGGQPEPDRDIFQMGEQVGQPPLERRQILLFERPLGGAPVMLERPHGVGLRLQTAVDALDQWANGSNQEAGQ